jgi:hypothetical protein
MQIESAEDLDVYKLANEFAIEIFEITKKQHHVLTRKCAAIGRMLGGMIKKSESFLVQG